MLEVTSSKIENFVENFLNAAMFNELPGEQQDSLKEFLTEYLIRLYKDNTDNIISLLEQLETINPFMIKMALGYGLLEEDVVELIRILFMKINEYFYKQGSFELIKNLRRIFEYYGLASNIYRVIYNKTDNKYILENVETGEIKDSVEDEFITPGHIVHKADYFANVFENNYDTIVIYISLEMYAYVDKKMQQPIALLHAYSISIHRNNTVQFFVNGTAYDLNLEQFLDVLRFYYLHYLKVKYPSFELNESGLEMWSLFITDPDDIQNAEHLLTELLSFNYDSRDGLAYFIRTSSFILNKYRIQTQPRTYDEIHTHVYAIDNELVSAIDSLTEDSEFVYNLNITMLYYDQYLNTLPNSTILDQYVRNTLRYLFMFVALNMVTSFNRQVKNMIYKFKKYFLPIYTQFFFDEAKKFKIRNDFFRLYTDDKLSTFTQLHKSSLIDPRDNQIMTFERYQKDLIFDILDTAHIIVNSKEQDSLNSNYEDYQKMYLVANYSDIYDIDDSQIIHTRIYQDDNTDILDNVVITIE